MAVIHEETLRLPRYEEMTFTELMNRVDFCKDMARTNNDSRRKWLQTACWICEVAAKNLGALPKDEGLWREF